MGQRLTFASSTFCDTLRGIAQGEQMDTDATYDRLESKDTSESQRAARCKPLPSRSKPGLRD